MKRKKLQRFRAPIESVPVTAAGLLGAIVVQAVRAQPPSCIQHSSTKDSWRIKPVVGAAKPRKPAVCANDANLPSALPLLGRVSDAGRLRDGAACSAAGVRKPHRKETGR